MLQIQSATRNFSPELKSRPNLLQLNVLPTIDLLEVVMPERDKVVMVGKCDNSLAVLLHQYNESFLLSSVEEKIPSAQGKDI